MTAMLKELEKLREITNVLTANGYLIDRTKEWEFVLDAVPALVFIVDAEYEIKFVNKSFADAFNNDKDYFKGQYCFDIFNHTEEFCITSCKEDTPEDKIAEIYIECLNGWYHRAKSSIFNDSNKFLGYIIHLQDITERKLSEIALEESERHHRNIVESSIAGMHMYKLINGELIFMEGNPSADIILGVDHSKLVGKPIEEAFPGLVGTGVPENYKKTALRGIPWHVEELVYNNDGLTGVYEVTAFQTSYGKMTVMFNDISKRKKYESELKKLSSVVEQSQVSVVITDPEGTIEYVNPKFTDVSGYTREEAIGENPRILKADIQSEEFYKEMWDTLVRGEGWAGEFANKRKNGEIYWENSVISPLRTNGSDEVTHYVAVKEDITERKLAEQRLQESEDRFKMAIESTVDLVYERSIPKNGVTWFGDIDGMLGYEPGEFPRTFDSWLEHVHETDRHVFDNAAEKMNIGNVVTGIEYKMKHKSGKLLTWVDRGKILFDDNNKPTKIIGVCKDITEQRKFDADTKKTAAYAEKKIKNRLSRILKGKNVYNVLIIEDNKELCNLIETYFSKTGGYNIFTAYNGVDGLKRACEIEPDVLILDLKLPDMCGFDISEKLNNKFPHMPIIVLSGMHTFDEKANSLIESGVWSYLNKPIEMSKLKYVVETMVNVSNMMKENNLFKEYLKLKTIDEN